MLRRISNFLHRDQPRIEIEDPNRTPARRPRADRAPRLPVRDRNANAALRPANEHRPERAVSPPPLTLEQLAVAVARLELGQRRAQQAAAPAEEAAGAPVNNAVIDRQAPPAEHPPAALLPPVGAAADQPAGAAAEPQPAAPAPVRQPPEPFDLQLSDLRMHRDETDHNLVFAYPIPAGVYEPVALAVDAASAGLEGRA